jgi:hypothetical protein
MKRTLTKRVALLIVGLLIMALAGPASVKK